jgi:hypothetical protein
VKSKYWIKLYHEILDDPKMGSLSDRLWRRVIELFLLAGDYDKDGQLPDLEWMAWRIRRTAEEIETDLVEIAKAGIVESKGGMWEVANFAERQAKSPATERTQRWRREKVQGHLWGDTKRSGDESVTKSQPEEEEEEEIDIRVEKMGPANSAVPSDGFVPCPRCGNMVNPIVVDMACSAHVTRPRVYARGSQR